MIGSRINPSQGGLSVIKDIEDNTNINNQIAKEKWNIISNVLTENRSWKEFIRVSLKDNSWMIYVNSVNEIKDNFYKCCFNKILRK